MALQNHYYGTNNPRLYVGAANTLTKDKAVTSVTVVVDTSQWSSRKKNIIKRSLRTGIAACGWEMAELVAALAHQIGMRVNTITKYSNTIRGREVKPDRLDELLAYTSAWCRMVTSKNGDDQWSNYRARNFLEAVGSGSRPDVFHIPINPTMTHDEKRSFLHEYLLASERTPNEHMEELIRQIENGESITITYDKA